MPVQRAHRPGTTWRWGLHASSTQLNSSTKAAFASGEFEKEKKKKKSSQKTDILWRAGSLLTGSRGKIREAHLRDLGEERTIAG